MPSPAAWVAPRAPDAAPVFVSTVVPEAFVPLAETVTRVTTPPAAPPEWGTLLAIAWAVLSALAFFAVLRAAVGLASDRRRWKPATVNGRDVMISESLGPALVGLIRPVIVMPAWSLDLSEHERELVLRHEEEHRRAGDPQWLEAGLALLVLMPWNPALWWQVHRMRLAVEIDCDRRVLALESEVRSYAELLLDMSERSVGLRVGALAFGKPAPFIDRWSVREPVAATDTRLVAQTTAPARLTPDGGFARRKIPEATSPNPAARARAPRQSPARPSRHRT